MEGVPYSWKRWGVVALSAAFLVLPDRFGLAQETAAPVGARVRVTADPPRNPARDLAIVRVNDEGGYPSSQQPPPMMQQPPPMMPQSPPMMPQSQTSYFPTQATWPMMANPTMQMPVNAYINQVGPTMAPSVVNVPTLVYLPQMTGTAMTTGSSMPSFFLPTQSGMMAQQVGSYGMPAQSVGQPMMGQSMFATMGQPMVGAPSQPVSQPFATAGSVTALTNQSVSLPTSRSSTKVRVRGPGLVGSGLARFGERLTLLGKTRIETIQETEMQASFTQPSGGVATIQTAAATPMMIPQSTSYTTQPQVQAQPQSPAPPPTPPAPMATPQTGPARSHFWHR